MRRISRRVSTSWSWGPAPSWAAPITPRSLEARRRGVAVTSFPELIGEITAGRRNTVVAGSFGKSTCSALMAHVLRQAGHDAGWMIGAISPSLPATGHWGSEPQVVLEGDEYIVGPADRRSKFALYHPRDVLLTSLVHDHVNVFPTFADYEAPFRELLRLLPADGLLVAREHPAIRAIAGEAAAASSGTTPSAATAGGRRTVVYGETTRFTLMRPDGGRLALSTVLLGEHNIENIVGVSAYLLERGLVSEPALQAAVASFGGIRRRLDRLTGASLVPVIEGFGSCLRKGPLGHRSPAAALSAPAADRGVRAAHLLLALARCAELVRHGLRGRRPRADRAPANPRGADPITSTFEEILARTAATGVPVQGVRTADEAIGALSGLAGNEVVLLLSSGPLLGLPDALPPVFDRLYAPPAAAVRLGPRRDRLDVVVPGRAMPCASNSRRLGPA